MANEVHFPAVENQAGMGVVNPTVGRDVSMYQILRSLTSKTGKTNQRFEAACLSSFARGSIYLIFGRLKRCFAVNAK